MRAIYNLLIRASADMVIKIAADPKHRGAKVGITSVLHTWGSAMTHHLLPGSSFLANRERAHVHMVVPGGGLSLDGTEWIPSRANFFLSVRVLSRLFRRLFLEGLSKLHRAGKLSFFGDHAGLADPSAFNAMLVKLRKLDWQARMGRLCQGTFYPTEGCVVVPVAIHSQGRHLEQPSDQSR